MTTTPDTQTGSTSNGNGATHANGSKPIVSDEALAAAEKATQTAAGTAPVGDRPTIPDTRQPAHDDVEIPGTKKSRNLGIAVWIAAIAALLGAAIFMAYHLGNRNAGTTVVTKTAPVPAGLVPKDTDDSACTFVVAPQGATYASGWCTGKAAGAYLFDDNTVAYCSCGKPRVP